MTASFTWIPPLDPQEIKDYTFKINKELTAAVDTLPPDNSAVVWTLSSIAVTAGLLIHASTHQQTGELTVWLKVNVSQQAAGMFDPPNGTLLELSFIATTTGGRTFHKTIGVRVLKG